jgi:uncharacterized pyridoxal phosphate-containing UPF0001 family protein
VLTSAAHGDGPTECPANAFKEMKRLHEAGNATRNALPVITMGMSGDFRAALAAGSTMLRLGQVLFGPRPG